MFLGIWLESLGDRENLNAFFWEHLVGLGLQVILMGTVVCYSGFAALHAVQHVASPVNRASWLICCVVGTIFVSCYYYCTVYQRFRREGRGGLILRGTLPGHEASEPEEHETVWPHASFLTRPVAVVFALVVLGLMAFSIWFDVREPFLEHDWSFAIQIAITLLLVFSVMSYCGFAVMHAAQHVASPQERAVWTIATIALHVFGSCLYLCTEYQRFRKVGKGGIVVKAVKSRA